jgi:phosphatidylserine decarboxylase
MFSKIFPKIHAEGYKFLVISGIITIVFYSFSNFLGLIGLVLTIWVYYFFRDPDRVIIDDNNYLVSPADGEIIKVEEVDGPKELGLENKKFNKISVFMNVFDCHVNRTPCAGKIDISLEHLLMLLLIKQVKITREIILKLRTQIITILL